MKHDSVILSRRVYQYNLTGVTINTCAYGDGYIQLSLQETEHSKIVCRDAFKFICNYYNILNAPLHVNKINVIFVTILFFIYF